MTVTPWKLPNNMGKVGFFVYSGNQTDCNEKKGNFCVKKSAIEIIMEQ